MTDNSHLSSQKRIGCLCLAFLMSARAPHEEWLRFYKQLCDEFGEKSVLRKMEKLAQQGYIEYGTSVRMGWLTMKGIELFRQIKIDAQQMGACKNALAHQNDLQVTVQ